MEADQDIKTEALPVTAAPLAAADSSDLQRREFLKRCGAYSAGAAVGFYILMRPGTVGASGDGADTTCGEDEVC